MKRGVTRHWLTRRMGGTLVTGLVAYWKLDEFSSGAGAVSRQDTGVGALHLTDNGNTPSAAGRVNLGASLNGTTRYLSRAHHASLAFGNTDFTFGIWFNQSGETAGVHPLIGKGNAPGTNQDYLIYCYLGGARFHTYNGTDVSFLAIPQISTVPAGWNFLLCWQDVTANTLNMQLNNGAVVSDTRTGPAAAATGGFAIGAGFGTAYLFAGGVDEVGVWSRVLTPVERSALWNWGAGKTHPF